MDADLTRRYNHSTTAQERRYWSRAGLANMLLWLGWIRSGELFNLEEKDIKLVLPADGPALDLPAGMGCLLLCLREETKSDRTK
jgi:hypothetical protein